jgi:hypothetical protein
VKKITIALTVLVGVALSDAGFAGIAPTGIGFEPPPYTNGFLIAGQDGWTDGITVSITETNPIAETQSAIATDMSGAPGNDGLNLYSFRNITGFRTWADGTRISTLFRVENNGTSGGFFDFRFDTAAGFLGDVTVNSHVSLGNIVASGTIMGLIEEGVAYQLVVEFNFTADTYDAFVQRVSPSDPSVILGTVGSALGVPFVNSSSAADANTTTMLLLRAQNSGSSPGAAMLFDNVLIESTNTLSVDATDIAVADTPALSFGTEAGFNYHLQATPDLVSSNYSDVGTYVEGDGQTQVLFDPDGASTSRNYQVVSAPDGP